MVFVIQGILMVAEPDAILKGEIVASSEYFALLSNYIVAQRIAHRLRVVVRSL